MENARKNIGRISIKKHYATKNCPIYDVTIYRHLKTNPKLGLCYYKITFEEVQALLEQGTYYPTKMSEALFYKKFKEG